MRILVLIISCLWALNTKAQETYQLMFYNVLNYPSSDDTKADTLKRIIDYTHPDLLMLTEITSADAVDLLLEDALNTDGETAWESAPFIDGPDTDNLLLYKSTLFTLVESNPISTNLRDINEYVLYLNTSTTLDTAFLYVYVSHLKAGNSSENAMQRTLEATVLKNYIDERTAGEHFIISGDFNVYGASENAYQTLLNYGLNFNDPINQSGEWHTNWNYADIHTQSTRTANLPDGGSTGGMDDRFDFMLISDDLLDGTLSYVPDSYQSFGQDGEHYNVSMLAVENSSIPNDINNALYYMSDHLPVLMQLTYDASASTFVPEKNIEKGKLINITDLLGRKVNPQSNKLLFYTYENGVVEKRLILLP